MHSAHVRVLLAAALLASFLFASPPQPAPAQSKGDFVTVQGNQLVYKGKPIKLKGINFYPKDQPWDRMWKQWNGPAAQRDLARAAELGINSVRILVPYEHDTGWTNKETGQVRPDYLNQLQQMVQVAGDMNLKVIIALFDFYDLSDDDWLPGSPAEVRHKLYIQTIVSTFANDDRVLAWDLHNEPDQYYTWRELRNPKLWVDWLAMVATEVRRLDHNHPITVGMSQFDHLYVADNTGSPYLEEPSRGRTAADISDFLSFHSYNAGNMDWQIHYISTRANKPVVLQETGWPSGPPCQQPDYSEEKQVALYNLMVQAARKHDIAGLMQWQLWDLGPSGGQETHEGYFGLLRRDGSWKPAMPVFRDAWPGPQASVSAPGLPSQTKSNLPLTIQPRPDLPPDPNYVPPIYFPETGHYIYGSFRDYWRRFGGLEVFGYPLTEQRKEGGMWVQYFERARFEYHEDNFKKDPNWDNLDKASRLKLVMLLTRLGADLVEKKGGNKAFPLPDLANLPPGATLFKETGHYISGKIAEYWWSHDGIANFGYPLSDPVQEISQNDGKPYTVQYFERTRLELHPENAGTPYEIQLGHMGRELLASKGCK
jgi:hypothetical protein